MSLSISPSVDKQSNRAMVISRGLMYNADDDQTEPRPRRATIAPLALCLIILVIGAVASFSMNGYYVFVLANVALLALCGIGLNVLLGLTGQISFGHVGFYAIGAYVTAILTTSLGVSFWIAWPLAALAAAFTGALLAMPALRVKGPFLAMITIAFGFIVEHSIVELRDLTGGQNGIMGIDAPTLGSVASGEHAVTLIALGTVAVALIAFAWLSSGTWGAAMRAVRDSETAAASVGLNPFVIKTVAFAVSALLAGAAGALFAPLSGFVTPHTFNFMQSILFVLIVMLGGAGSIAGPIFGAIIVGLMPEILSGMEEARLLFFGLLLLVVLWAAPTGLVGLWQRLVATLGAARSQRSRQDASDAPDAPQRSVLKLVGRQRQALSARGLSKRFGGLSAVSTLDLDAACQQITSLIGPNGAGKTTALNILSGFYRADAGSFSLGGSPIDTRRATHIARRGIARTYQTSQLFDSLTVRANVLIAMRRGRLGGLFSAGQFASATENRRALELLRACGYDGDPERLASDLPHVDRRLVEIARALALDPDALLLDEPAAGLARDDKEALAVLLREIAEEGVAVLLVEHDMPLVMGVSDRVVVLDAGEHLSTGSVAEVQIDPAVRKAYLGDGKFALQRDSEALTTIKHDGQGSVDRAVAESSPQAAIEVEELTAGYGAEPVLRQVSLTVNHREAIAILGANGAGKSTLMRSLVGLHKPISGTVRSYGRLLSNMPTETITAGGLVLVPEGRQVFGDLTVADNLRLGAFTDAAHTEMRLEQMIERFPRLQKRYRQRAGLLSGGEQQMLAIGRALMSAPQVLLLDEPSLGLAPRIIDELFTALDDLRRDGMTLLLVDQMATLALAIADRAYVMESGQIVATGTAKDIAGDEALTKAYLGA